MIDKRPFRFGTVSDGANTRAEWQEQARRIEESGFDTLLVPDHLFTRFSPEVALLSAADATRHLRVGSFVCNNSFRHPAILAKEAATLDILTDGRFDLGIGAGWHQGEYDQAGISFDAPGARLSRLEESVHIIKRLFADDGPVSFIGKYYTITDLKGLPRPVQRPHPDIFIGGAGKRLLSLAAREADIVGLNMSLGTAKTFDEMSSAKLEQRVQWVREAAAGERFGQLKLNLLLQKVIVTDDPEDVAEEFIRRGGWGDVAVRRDQIAQVSGWEGVTVKQLLDIPYFFIGTLSHCVEKLHRLREQHSISYFSVFPEGRADFARIIAAM